MLSAWLFCSTYALVSVYANNEFRQPPPAGMNASFHEPFLVSWRCDDCGRTPISLSVYQDKKDGDWAKEVLLNNVTNPGDYSWDPHSLQSLPMSNGFHFQMLYDTHIFDSGALFLVDAVNSSTVSSENNENNSDNLKVGLGVGLGVGIPLFLLIGVIFGYVIFRQRSKLRQNAAYDLPRSVEVPASNIKGPPLELRTDTDPRELPHESQPSELYGGFATASAISPAESEESATTTVSRILSP